MKWSSASVMMVMLLLLAGCNNLKLEDRNLTGEDLSGLWVIDFAESDLMPDRRGALEDQKKRPRPNRANGPDGPQRGIPDLSDIGRGSDLDFVSHDFQVLRADKMTIEQNRDSMGIRYTPGVYRDISWGERQRGLWEVYAGWDEQDLVVVSKTRNLRVEERFLDVSPTKLIVNVNIKTKEDRFTFRRVFNRVR